MSLRSKNASAMRPKRVLSRSKVNATCGSASPELMRHNAPDSDMSGVSRACHSCAAAGADRAAAIAAVATILKPGNRISSLQSAKPCRHVIGRRNCTHPPVQGGRKQTRLFPVMPVEAKAAGDLGVRGLALVLERQE